MRALAILGVLLVHAGAPGFRSGWIGVDLFFALSGFLITTLLLMESSATGQISLGSFMVRRLLRLMPAYFLYAALMTALIWSWPGSIRTTNGHWDAAGLTAALWGYAVNFVPQGGIWNGQILTVHLWSLSVEQQYYVVWPLVVLLLHRRRSMLMLTGSALTAASLATYFLTPDGLYHETMLFTRGFSLVAASTVATFAAEDHRWLANLSVARAISAFGALTIAALFVVPYLTRWPESEVRSVFLPVLLPVFIFWIARIWYIDDRGFLGQILSWRPLVYIGKISYGIYLYHELVRVITWYFLKPAMESWPSSLAFAVRLVCYAGVSMLLAAVSFNAFESQFLKLAARFRPKRVALASGQ